MHEWRRGDSVFHAKGVWYAPPGSDPGARPVTVVGSTNYGARSELQDLESNAYVVTDDDGLAARLGSVWGALVEQSAPRDPGKGGAPPWIAPLAVLFKRFL